ncbi:PAAR domain-containing protein [Paraburkholderia caledonica]|uniref:PAAR domain-containing protein n=1 Tax=Paraburkholderia caledonica TaxID=134536 RepID=UPI000D769053|nr:PAAR domain-containing protein [Paraburkholderia caledonica]AXF13734.1 PAAR domain-containing protein [Paraburkholderia caledonica]
MRRYFIVLGDKTTAGGVVIQGEESCRNHGKPLAYHGAQIYCHACKTTGYICNVPPYRPMVLMGKQAALENDICICKCSPAPRLIASQNNASMSFESGELAAMGFRPDGSPMPKETGAFDEQVRAVGQGASEGYPYFIETADGRTFSGSLDRNGQLPRVYTDLQANYNVCWGDEALAMQEGA